MTHPPLEPSPLSDLEIARRAHLEPILGLAEARLGLAAEELVTFGHHRAKLSRGLLERLRGRPRGRLVLVSAITPTPAGEGKTTTCVGLVDALSRLGVSAMVCLREPSLGPVFGMKGGAAGGGHAQVVPMEAINLHFNGDLHAVTAAHNLLAALLDNHLHWGNALGIDPARVTWPRVLDLNDRSLRRVRIGLGEEGGQSPRGTEREARFEITAASEVMAILCLAEDLADLERRLGRIVVAWRRWWRSTPSPATARPSASSSPAAVTPSRRPWPAASTGHAAGRERWRPSPPASMAPAVSSSRPRPGRCSSAWREPATEGFRSASPAPSIASRTTRPTAAWCAGIGCASASCASRPAPASWWPSAAS